ncbi:MAG: helix-turn-helix domain-containing protein [Defluviitaleaceae bacterium]|nr:helix-turn-helix domain-containing protein [Defluviitaleaceae bacterium]
MDTYNYLQHILLTIEANIKTKLTAANLAKTVALSPVHLQRLFRLAFEQPMAGYIRSRKLAASLEGLLKSPMRIIDIANEYGFEHEQSYIRAFKREYNMTPHEVRAQGRITQIVPPLHLAPGNKVGEGLFLGPDFVMVPTFHMVGRLHKIPFAVSDKRAPKVAKDFWDRDRQRITNRLGDDVYIGLTRCPTPITDFSYYLPSVPVNKPGTCPEGLTADTFPAALCARFHYIGRHHYFDLNADVARAMYAAIDAYETDANAKYVFTEDLVYFERIAKGDYDGTYCKMEWFAPVVEKR